MSSAAPHSDGRKVTLPQVLALMVIWTAVIYGLTAKRSADAAQISLKERPAKVACAKRG